MSKVNGFNYSKTDYIYIKEFKDNKWSEGRLEESDQITISAMSPALHYGQQAFEGIKAYMNDNDEINLFRIKDNAKRFKTSCERLLMPTLTEDEFIEAIKTVVLANKKYIPKNNKNETLYIRPLMIGVGDKLGVGPATDYMFIIAVTPVGSYFKEINPIKVLTTNYDRASHNGTGDIKVGGNYAASLYALNEAKSNGYNDCLFLDPKTHTYIEEVGAANFFGITNDNKYYTPNSKSILKSITNDSLKIIAKDYLNLEVIETDININDIGIFKEAGACGTGALITPIGSITHNNKITYFKEHKLSMKLKEILLDIQYGNLEDKYNWIIKIN